MSFELLEREWVPDMGWRTNLTDKQCRMIKGAAHVRCQNKAVAELRRGNGWWAYCAEHMYGRQIRNGVVMYFCVARPASKPVETIRDENDAAWALFLKQSPIKFKELIWADAYTKTRARLAFANSLNIIRERLRRAP